MNVIVAGGDIHALRHAAAAALDRTVHEALPDSSDVRSQQCAHDAACPVVIVRSKHEAS